MSILRLTFVALLGAFVTVSLAGCADSGAGSTAANRMAEGKGDEHGDHDHEHGDHEHGDHEHGDHAGHDHDAKEIEAELAKLSPEDREKAKAQGDVCIVSGEPLGAMGAPVLVKDVEGHDLFICCAGCEGELRKDPAKYLAKLEKKEEAPK